MFDGQFRPQIENGLRPVGQSLRKVGITADHLTIAGLVLSVGAAVAIGYGAFTLALLLTVLTGVPDLLDGAVAKASGTAGPRGAFFDSVSDRVTDSLLFGGLAVYYSQHRPDLVVLPVAALATASWVSYLRAKADALGFDGRGGLVERAERFILFCLGLLFPVLMVYILVLMIGLNLATAVQRFAKVWRQASAARVVTVRSRRRPRRPREPLSERWRSTERSRSARPRT